VQPTSEVALSRAWGGRSFSHRKKAAPAAALVKSRAGFTISLVPIGMEEFLAARSIN